MTQYLVFLPALSDFMNTVYVVLNYIFKLIVSVSSGDNAGCYIINGVVYYDKWTELIDSV